MITTTEYNSNRSRSVYRLAFNTEINYIVLQAINQLYECLLNCYKSFERAKHFSKAERFSINYTRIKYLYAICNNTLKIVDEQNLFGLLGEKILDAKIKPSDYPKETLEFLREYLNHSGTRKEVIDEYCKLCTSIEIDKVKKAGVLIKEVIKEHIKTAQEGYIFFETKRGLISSLIGLWKEDSIDEMMEASNEYSLVLQESVYFVVSCCAFLEEGYETALETINLKLLHLYFNNLLSLSKVEYDTPDNKEINEAFFYNVERINSDIVKYDGWMLGKRHFDDLLKNLSIYELNKLITLDEKLLKENKAKVARLILNDGYGKKAKCLFDVCNTHGLINNINKSDDVKKIHELMSQNILALLDLYRSYNLEQIGTYDNFGTFISIIQSLGYSPVGISEGDRLDLEKCQTLEVVDTDDISLDFTIYKIHQTGMYYKNDLVRKSFVSVYRYKMD